jgi:hypothetical protein
LSVAYICVHSVCIPMCLQQVRISVYKACVYLFAYNVCEYLRVTLLAKRLLVQAAETQRHRSFLVFHCISIVVTGACSNGRRALRSFFFQSYQAAYWSSSRDCKWRLAANLAVLLEYLNQFINSNSYEAVIFSKIRFRCPVRHLEPFI